MTDKEVREYITITLLARFAAASDKREEALREVLGISVYGIDDAEVATLATQIPQLSPSLYKRWIGLFASRLLETVQRDQIEDLCNGTEKSTAALTLVYVMFMESERMEKLVTDDLKALGVTKDTATEDAAQLGAWLRQHMGVPVQ